ncbi:Do family serine endopeptidase [bacterium]|nr:Do family serine endopeptidase [bacterium]
MKNKQQLGFLSVLAVIVLGVSCADLQSKELWKEDVVVGKEIVGEEVHKINQAFTGLAEVLSGSVVSISTKTKVIRDRRYNPQADVFRYFFGNPFGGRGGIQPPPQESSSLGSGFLINEDGYLVTNSHVVTQGGRQADEIFAKFAGDSAKFEGWPAEIVGVDPTTDVAVLKLKEKPKALYPAYFGDSSKLKVGEWVMAIGNPFGHSHSVTSGIVSALGRAVDDLNTRSSFIQTDASINPGNSGGPLFNMKGQVIGINTAIDARANGIGFAIPIDLAKTVIKQLIQKGSVDIGWIGIYMADLTPGIAKQLGLAQADGVLIQDVIPGEPAASAGMKSYDVVLAVDGKEVSSTGELFKAVGNKAIGESAKILVHRNGKQVTLNVKIGKRKTEQELAAARDAQIRGRLEDSKGMLLEEINPQVRSMLGLEADVQGVFVQQLVSDGFAAQAGVRPGDVIVEINRKPVTSVKEAVALLKKSSGEFLLKILREDSTIIILIEDQ